MDGAVEQVVLGLATVPVQVRLSISIARVLTGMGYTDIPFA